MKKFAVVLAGNGVFDGAEIHEATLTLYAIMKHGASYEIFAPDIPQHHVINHITGEEMPETRNVLEALIEEEIRHKLLLEMKYNHANAH